jgi:hypothetical protein
VEPGEPANPKPAKGSAVAGFGLGCLLNIAIVVVAVYVSRRWFVAVVLIQLVVITPLSVLLWRKEKTRTVAGLISSTGITFLLMSLCSGLSS